MNFKKILFVLTLALLVVTMSVVSFADEESTSLGETTTIVDESSDDSAVDTTLSDVSDSDEDLVMPLGVDDDTSVDETSEEPVTSVLTDGDTTYSAPEQAGDTADDTAATDMQELAQTGMTQWPIIVCGIAGAVLVIIGIILVVNSKKKKVK